MLLAAMTAAMVVTLAVGGKSAKAAFPGDNGAIAFEVVNSGVYRMSSDGFGQTKLSDTPGNNGNPAWSADGEKIAFVNLTGTETLNNEIYWMDSDGEDSSEINLTDHPAHDTWPAFFPDHHTIAFTSTREGGDTDIFKMTVDDNGDVTSGPIQLTTYAGSDVQPVVSPNGKKVAFVSDRDGGDSDIYVMKANAPEGPANRPVKLTRSAAFDTQPDWSPNGKKLAFQSDRSGGNLEIFVMKAVPESRTNRPRNLTKNAANDFEPAFSPSGKKIAFTSNRDGVDTDIFKMKADGSGPVNLTSDSAAAEEQPSWQPDP